MLRARREVVLNDMVRSKGVIMGDGRNGARRTVTMKGKPMTLFGAEIKVGQKAPPFKLLATDMSFVELVESKRKIRLLSVVPSLDTEVCDLQTRRFEAEAANFKDVVIYAISMDLPFAQARYCGANEIKKLKTLSDHREASFGRSYGTLIEELRLLARSIFIVDWNDVIQYVEYVPELTNHPNYEEALAALKRVVSRKNISVTA